MKVGDVGWVIDSPVNEDDESMLRYPAKPWMVKVIKSDPKYRFMTRAREIETTCGGFGFDETCPDKLYATEREAWIAYADALQKNVIRDACEVARVRRTYAPDSVPVNSPGETMHSAYALWLNDIDDGEGPWNDLPDNVKAAFELAAGAVIDAAAAAASANEEPSRVLLSADDVATFIALGGLEP